MKSIDKKSELIDRCLNEAKDGSLLRVRSFWNHDISSTEGHSLRIRLGHTFSHTRSLSAL